VGVGDRVDVAEWRGEEGGGEAEVGRRARWNAPVVTVLIGTSRIGAAQADAQ
jgi:hypothetical protein